MFKEAKLPSIARSRLVEIADYFCATEHVCIDDPDTVFIIEVKDEEGMMDGYILSASVFLPKKVL